MVAGKTRTGEAFIDAVEPWKGATDQKRIAHAYTAHVMDNPGRSMLLSVAESSILVI